jgi:hypothetical protein
VTVSIKNDLVTRVFTVKSKENSSAPLFVLIVLRLLRRNVMRYVVPDYDLLFRCVDAGFSLPAHPTGWYRGPQAACIGWEANASGSLRVLYPAQKFFLGG